MPLTSRRFCYKIFSVVIVVFLTGISNLQAQSTNLTCYSCTYHPDVTTCLDAPEDVNNPGFVICDKRMWCRTQRREPTETPGHIHELSRGCYTDFNNSTKIDAHFINYVTSCNTDYCNDGDGKRSDPPDNAKAAKRHEIQAFVLALAAFATILYSP